MTITDELNGVCCTSTTVYPISTGEAAGAARKCAKLEGVISITAKYGITATTCGDDVIAIIASEGDTVANNIGIYVDVSGVACGSTKCRTCSNIRIKCVIIGIVKITICKVLGDPHFADIANMAT